MDSECDLHQSGLQGEGRQQPRHPGAGEHARGGSDETFCTFVPTATESIHFYRYPQPLRVAEYAHSVFP